jgi:hypothetical protein
MGALRAKPVGATQTGDWASSCVRVLRVFRGSLNSRVVEFVVPPIRSLQEGTTKYTKHTKGFMAAKRAVQVRDRDILFPMGGKGVILAGAVFDDAVTTFS